MFVCLFVWFFFFKQKTAYEMRISDWSSDVCSSDLVDRRASGRRIVHGLFGVQGRAQHDDHGDGEVAGAGNPGKRRMSRFHRVALVLGPVRADRKSVV